jgi:valyl-tRNA synthetase
MSQATAEMPKTYTHHHVEESLYTWWNERGYFHPEQQIASGLADPNAKPFVISMPPPNVTGALHLGHAITSSVEDMLIRYNRMVGRPTLWVPGTDHAGIATQNVVERMLLRQGVTRQQLGRERFVEEVWSWKDEYHGRITAQQQRMGISCDWQRERFTLDEGLSAAVLEAFIRLYQEGLIYRGQRLVNWCPRCETAISDLEVEYEEVIGAFYTFRYPLKEGGWLEVSTTRPETILGDTAVAVHPDDARYTHLVGKTAIVPMLNREIPVIADAYVDPEFGTGALKVTPGHDPNDYEIGLRHDLAMVNIMNKDGSLNDAAGPYANLDRFAARRRLWEDMGAAGLTVREEERSHQVGHCQRCNTVVEPLLSEQWWARMKPLAEPAIEAVRSGAIRIVPQRFEKIYYQWMENIRDWCISRQLWWGHRIPIWYGPDGQAFAARSHDDAATQARAHYGREVALEQDPDVLDTWFSSGLWPFSTLGWPQQTPDLATYYPTSVMETGYDILFFWVARMIMLGMKFTDQVPFDTVYLHGLVRDEKGRKMSKSLNNALDPLDLIADYGADALRFTLLTGSTPGNDMKLSVQRVEASRNFANKIWNAARFVVMNFAGRAPALEATDDRCANGYALPDLSQLPLADRWILSRFDRLVGETTRLIDEYQLGEGGRELYEFLWNEYCDWYIEAAKVALTDAASPQAHATRQVLAYVLERSLRLLHPFMPFVTEAIWQNLPGMTDGERALMVTRWPQPSGLDDAQADDAFGRIQEIVRSVRNARTEYDVQPGKRIPAHISAGVYEQTLNDNLPLLALLARIDAANTVIRSDLPAPDRAVTLAMGSVTVYLPLAGLVDFAAERARLGKEMENIDRQVQRIEGLLGNPGFTEKAPAAVIERERAKLVELLQTRQQLQGRLDELRV